MGVHPALYAGQRPASTKEPEDPGQAKRRSGGGEGSLVPIIEPMFKYGCLKVASNTQLIKIRAVNHT